MIHHTSFDNDVGFIHPIFFFFLCFRTVEYMYKDDFHYHHHHSFVLLRFGVEWSDFCS